MVFAERAGDVERPEFLRFSGKAFATRIVNDRNAPAYRTRDIILVDPESPEIVGEDCMFANDLWTLGKSLVVVGCLILSTGDVWKVRQYNIKGDMDLPKTEFPYAWPIVGRYNRR